MGGSELSAPDVDVVVVGGGVVGLSAAYWCAREGRSVRLLEAATFGHERSSSKGATRLFRVLYAREHAARLAQVSLDLWHDLEKRAGERLLDRTGILFHGVDGPETREGNLDGCDRVMERLGIPHESYDGREIERVFPVFDGVGADWCGYFESEGAVIHADRVLRALERLARERGAELRENAPVTGIRPLPGRGNTGVEVTYRDAEGGDRTVVAGRVILAPGPFANEVLAHLGLSLDLEIWRMTYAHFAVTEDRDAPLWFHFGADVDGETATYYGFPADPETGRVKAGADFTFHKARDPRALDLEPDPRILERISGFLTRHLRGIDPTPLNPRACLYTMTRDFEPVLDFVPGRRDVVVFAGGSGGAFKFAPLLGRTLFELASYGESRVDLLPWAVDRAAVRAS